MRDGRLMRGKRRAFGRGTIGGSVWRAASLIPLALLAAAPVHAAEPARAPLRIYLAPDDHTDYMWTADEQAYARAHVDMLDYYLDQADKTDRDPAAFRSKWFADGSFWIWTYEQRKSAAAFERLMRRIGDGAIGVPLNASVSAYGGTPTEAVLRGMYYAGDLQRRFGVRLPLAIAMETQTLPYGLGALWAGAGARYSWKGVCTCLTKIDATAERPHEIYWWKGDDGSRLLMKWNTNLGGDQVIGSYAEAREPAAQIRLVTGDPVFKRRWPYDVIGIFGHGWDDLTTRTDLFPKVARAESNRERQVIVSNMTDFFEDFERTHGAKLPEQSASFGNEWDLYTASVQGLASRVRRAVEKLRSAESMASMVVAQKPQFMAARKAARDQAWINLGMFWEHDWTADSPHVSKRARTEWARRLVGEIERYVDALHADSAAALSGLIAAGAADKRFFVFNPLGWTRSDAADLPLADESPVHAVDLVSGKEAASQIVSAGGRRMLRLWAQDLPPVGYRVYALRAGPGAAFPPAATATPGVADPSPWKIKGMQVENAAYRINVAGRGALLSLVDKTRGDREFLRQGFGERTNDLGLDIEGETIVESAGPVSLTVRAESASPLKHTTRVTLYRASRRIDISNEITQNFDGAHAWAFSFALKSPVVRHEEIGVVATAATKENGGHYSSTLSNLEWLSLNHFADMSEPGGAGVTLSNADLAFMKLGNSVSVKGRTTLDTATPMLRVLAGGQIDGPQAGIPGQGGDTYFLQRFALQTHGGYNPAAAMRMALEHQNPPVAAMLRGGAALPAKTLSLLRNSNPDVLLWALKPAEAGPCEGLTARVWNVGASPQTYRLGLSGGIARAFAATHVEVDQAAIPVSNGEVTRTANATQIQTLRLLPAKRSRAGCARSAAPLRSAEQP